MDQLIETTVINQQGLFDCMIISNIIRENGMNIDHHDVASVLDIMREKKIITRVSTDDAIKYKVVTK